MGRKRNSGMFTKNDPRINRKGAPPGNIHILTILRRVCSEPISREAKMNRIEAIIRRMCDDAEAGDCYARRDLFDRLEGRPKQTVGLGVDGEDGKIRIEYTLDDTDGDE